MRELLDDATVFKLCPQATTLENPFLRKSDYNQSVITSFNRNQRNRRNKSLVFNDIDHPANLFLLHIAKPDFVYEVDHELKQNESRIIVKKFVDTVLENVKNENKTRENNEPQDDKIIDAPATPTNEPQSSMMMRLNTMPVSAYADGSAVKLLPLVRAPETPSPSPSPARLPLLPAPSPATLTPDGPAQNTRSQTRG